MARFEIKVKFYVMPIVPLPQHPPLAGAVAPLHLGHGSSDALAVAQLVQQLISKKQGQCVLLLTAQAWAAQRLYDEVKYFAPSLRSFLLPDWETLPYDTLSPHQDLISERLNTLYSLQSNKADLIIAPVTTALAKIAPPSYLAANTFFFDKGQKLDEAQLRHQLVVAGYESVSQVVKPGELCIRGGLIDIFPMGAVLPLRLDLFGDEIESIRTFDPDNQRSVYPVDRVRMLPGREFPFDEPSRSAFRNRWRERFEGDPTKISLYKDIGAGISTQGIEYYLPLFFETPASIFDYLPANTLIVSHGAIEEASNHFILDAEQRFKFLSHDSERPVLAPQEIFLSTDALFAHCRKFGRYNFSSAKEVVNNAASTTGLFALAPPSVAINRRAENPLTALENHLKIQERRSNEHSDKARVQTVIIAETAGRRETLLQLLQDNGFADRFDMPTACDDWQAALESNNSFVISVGPIHEGFYFDDPGFALITELELFPATTRTARGGKKQAQTNVDAIIRDLSELKIGDPVVHTQHGIGRYEGLIALDLGEGEAEFLHLVYADKAVLYVPVSQLHVIGRYSGASPEDAPLHSLGSGQWEKAKRKAAEKARDTAAELLNLYARRALRKGHAFAFKSSDYELFTEGFAFEETADQLAAVHHVVQDMISDKPMDRLICGDVGFGKTEVALRAAFVAVSDSKQVAVLAPTTLLAEQHFRTFSDRFADFPVRIAELSRFKSAKEVKLAIEELNNGKLDIVIGTHKLLSPDVKFSRLGLVIIDEEHRFGVRQKEALKNLRAEVDLLSMTATPIPRTLAMSMEGIRDFSVIATAPQKRLAIKTFVRKEQSATIRESMLRELKRGGQVYFLHNEVETIENRRQMLAALVPEARIEIAHGQMPERELERVMRDFNQQRFNVLLCTTIIETGIDVPSANTIVIHRADRFGLAQLHQLRGRVGRSHHQAYAYLLIPDEESISKDATKRLDAIQSMEELGSGFFLAMHDLEIRGAGEVLGDSQSGEMQEIGFSLYADMLNLAVREMKAGRQPDLSAPLGVTTEINLHCPALLPNDFCGDVHERLTLYKRLANVDSFDALMGMQEELIDRFGKLPDPARALIETHRLRLQCQTLGITKLDAAEQAIVLVFAPKPPVPQEAIIRLIQSRKDAKLAGQDRLRISVASTDLASRLLKIREILSPLQKALPTEVTI
jgi:transcription-repair coupling factor (superfamily II helicase)